MNRKLQELERLSREKNRNWPFPPDPQEAMPDPTKYENREEFVADCMAERGEKYPNETRLDKIRLCNAIWEHRIRHPNQSKSEDKT